MPHRGDHKKNFVRRLYDPEQGIHLWLKKYREEAKLLLNEIFSLSKELVDIAEEKIKSSNTVNDREEYQQLLEEVEEKIGYHLENKAYTNND